MPTIRQTPRERLPPWGFVAEGVRGKLCGKSADTGENIIIMIFPGVLIVGLTAGRIEQTDTGGIERYGIV